jgi:1-acyl-sn-glycerol-3-phosphate acyltransferase
VDEPASSPRPHAPLAFRFLNLVIRLVVTLTRTRLVVEGTDHLPHQGGVIVASNHLSIADPPLICLAVWRAGRRAHGQAEAMEGLIMGPALRAYGFGVRRGQGPEAYRMSRAVLDTGDWLGLAGESLPATPASRARRRPAGGPVARQLPVASPAGSEPGPSAPDVPALRTTATVRFGSVLDLRASGRPDDLFVDPAVAERVDRRAALDAARTRCAPSRRSRQLSGPLRLSGVIAAPMVRAVNAKAPPDRPRGSIGLTARLHSGQTWGLRGRGSPPMVGERRRPEPQVDAPTQHEV